MGYLGIISVLMALIVGCTNVEYKRHNLATNQGPQSTEANFGRQVDYYIDREYFVSPPSCVLLLPVRDTNISLSHRKLVENALTRHLSVRVNRVIDPTYLLKKLQGRGLDPRKLRDIRTFALEEGCSAYLEINNAEISRAYAVVWTKVSAHVQLMLKNIKTDQMLWWGKHTAQRGDGGLPLTLIGAGLGSFSAGRLASDNDALPSVLEDSVRRLMSTLPDIRHP